MMNNKAQTKTTQTIICLFLTLFLMFFGVKTTFSQALISPVDNATCVSMEPALLWGETSGDATLEIFDCNNTISSIGLGNYTPDTTYTFTNDISNDLSGITYNPLTNTLFAITNGGNAGSIYEAIYEIDLGGSIVNTFNLIDVNESGNINNRFYDTEDIVHLYGRTFAVVEERKGTIAIIDLPTTSSNITYNNANIIQLSGSWGTNKGLEGITYDPVANKLHVVKELPATYYEIDIPTTFPAAPNTPSGPCDFLGTSSIDDAAAIHYMGLTSGFAGTDAENNQLIIDEDGMKIIEIDANCNIIDQLPLPGEKYEGITMDNNGTIYMAQEPNVIHVYTSPIAPGIIHTATMSGGGYIVPPNVLDEDTEYCWRVTNNGNTSATQSFTTIGTMTICTAISGGENDVEEWQDGTMSISSLDLEIAYNGNPIKLRQKIGLRYEDLGIPQGATIESAYLQFATHATSSGTINLAIHGENADNALPFTLANGNLSARPTTQASVAWSPPDWNTVFERGVAQQTPDLTAILQEIVNRNNYDQNSAIALIVSGFDTNNRVAKPYESSPAFAPQLCVTFTPVNCSPTCVEANISLWLEGPYDSTQDTMRTGLRNYNVLPAENSGSNVVAAGQPYFSAPWNYLGTEGIGWEMNDYTSDVVDWVLVSFRTTLQASSEVFKTAALLHKDGKVHFIDECPLPDNLMGESLYVVVDHRNHMVVMSHEAVPMISTATTNGSDYGIINYDFRQQDSYHTPTTVGQKQLPDGTWVLFAGDMDGNYDINGGDKTIWDDQNGTSGQYLHGDNNMDADVTGSDKGPWGNNSGYSSSVPK